jgi:glycosyltransferase involved in cell wall biosynthesis
MRKIYLVSPKFSNYIGGMETHGLEFAKHFSKTKDYSLGGIFVKKEVNDGIPNGKKCEIINSETQKIDGFIVNNILTGDFEKDAGKIIKRLNDGDILFLNSPTWVPIIKYIKEKKNVLSVVRSGGNDIPAGWIGNEDSLDENLNSSRERLVRYINEDVDILICNSNYSKANAIKLGVLPNKINVIKGGVDTSRFKPEKHNNEKKVIITTGRFVKFKGMNLCLKAIAELKKSKIPFEYRLIGSGPKKTELQKMVEELKLEDCVNILGPIEINEIQKYYQEADIFLHLPIYENRSERGNEYIHTETMGRTICEAMASGLPIVTSSVGGVPEMVGQEYEYLVDEKDFSSAVNFLSILLEDGGKAQSTGNLLRQRAENIFSWNKLFDKYCELFKKNETTS